MTAPVPSQRRTHALLVLALFLAYYAGMEIFVRHVVILLAPAAWFSLAYQALRLLLASAGVLIVARFFPASNPENNLNYPAAGGAGGWQWPAHEPARVAEGAAVGWAIVLALVLPIVMTGGLHAFFDFSAASVGRFLLIVLTTACGSALRQTVLAGLPLRWLSLASSPAFAIALMACFAALSVASSHGQRMGWTALVTVALFQGLCCVAALRTGSLWMGWGLDFSARIALGCIFGFPVLGSSLYSSLVLANSFAPSWLTGAEAGPVASLLAPLVVVIAIAVVVKLTPIDVIGNIRPGGIPVFLESSHAKGFGDLPLAGESLVQIGTPAGSDIASSAVSRQND